MWLIPTAVCTVWERTRAKRHGAAGAIQRAYRARIAAYSALVNASDAHGEYLVRMYAVGYPLKLLQSWPDLVMRRCLQLSDPQKKVLRGIVSIPPAKRTRRCVLTLFRALTDDQIYYVGW